MQRLRLIKGKIYLIDNIPHLYQENEDGIYRFLKIDNSLTGSLKYINEKDVSKIRPTLQDEAYENEISYYKEKYRYYQEKEKQEDIEKKITNSKKATWFSGSRFVQISTGLTLAVIIVFDFIISIEAGRKSENFGVGLLTFVGILISGFLISLLVAWLAYKAEGFVDEERNSDLIIKLLFFLPIVWFALFKLFQLLFLSKADTER